MRIGTHILCLFGSSVSACLLVAGCSRPTNEPTERQSTATAQTAPLTPNPSANQTENPPVPHGTETVMTEGMVISATTPIGNMTITAGVNAIRKYTWEGATRSVVMWPRRSRWYGSKGLYFPGPGEHWKMHNGISRAVTEEGQQHFNSVSEFKTWLSGRKYMPYVYNDSGLVVGWTKVLPRRQLNVEVWQVLIGGRKPTQLPGSNNLAIALSGIRK